MNTAQNLEDELQDHKETELAEAQQRLPGPRSPRAAEGGWSAPGTPAPRDSHSGKFARAQPSASGGAAATVDGSPSWTAAASRGRARGGRPSGRQGPGGRLGPPRGPGRKRALPRAGRRDQKGSGASRGAPSENFRSAARAPRAGALHTARRGPHSARSPAPARRVGPCGPRSGAPHLGGPALRTRGGARPPARGALTTARRSRLLQAAPPSTGTPPGPGAAAQARPGLSGMRRPAGSVGPARRVMACGATRAMRRPEPRGGSRRARPERRGGRERSARPEAPRHRGMRTALPAPALAATGADPAPVKPRPVDERQRHLLHGEVPRRYPTGLQALLGSLSQKC